MHIVSVQAPDMCLLRCVVAVWFAARKRGVKNIPLQPKDELLTSLLDFFLVCHSCGVVELFCCVFRVGRIEVSSCRDRDAL